MQLLHLVSVADFGKRMFWDVIHREQDIQQPLVGQFKGLFFHLGLFCVSHHAHRHFHQVADDAFHIPAHVAHLGELRGLHLDEGRVGQHGQPPGNLGLAHPGGADEDDVIGHDLFAEVIGDLEAAPAVAHGDGHRLLGGLLAHDVAVQFLHNLPGRQFFHLSSRIVSWSLE
ncbi:hypothetical protein ES703_61578 [subsurface metagenome]